MIDICPTVDAETPVDYRKQMEQVARFIRRVHIDVSDGLFTPNMLVPLTDRWWPDKLLADLHMMYKNPFDHAGSVIALSPHLVIVHAEAEGDFPAFADLLHRCGIKVGLALLQESSTDTIIPALEFTDHVLIFSGNLGYHGRCSTARYESAGTKLKRWKAAKPSLEIGWDGGVNDQNIKQLAAGGVEVINVGGFIQHNDNPEQAVRKTYSCRSG